MDGRQAVKQVGGGVEALGPEARQRGLDQKGAHDVVRRANHPLSLAVLGRYTDKTYAAEHPERGRRNGRWSY